VRPDKPANQPETAAMLTRDRIAALIFLAFSLAYGARTFEIPLYGVGQGIMTARTLPFALAIAGVLVSLALLVAGGAKDDGEDHSVRSIFGGLHWATVAQLLVLMVLYGLTIRWVGFILSTSLFLAIGYAILGERRWSVLLGASVPVVVAFWALLTQLLGVYLDPGSLWTDLWGQG
jgi:putative tricarboxylic transport membrane protein